MERELAMNENGSMRRGNLETPPDGENEKKLINKFPKAAQAGL